MTSIPIIDIEVKSYKKDEFNLENWISSWSINETLKKSFDYQRKNKVSILFSPEEQTTETIFVMEPK